MRVCHLTSVHPYNDPRIFLKECKSLAKAGYEVHLIAPNAPDGIIEGINLHSVKTRRKRIGRMTMTVREVYKKAISINADIYHFHDPELILVGYLLKKRGKKVIYDVHEDLPKDILSKQWIPSYLRKIVSKIAEGFEKYISKKIDAVVTATPFIKSRFINYNQKSIDIKNYPLLQEFTLEENGIMQKKDANTVCYVGSITKARGIYQMIKALEGTSITLLLGGTFPYENEKKEVEKLSGWKNVRELGWLDRKQVKETLRSSVAGLVVLQPIPSFICSLPVKMFEYMSAGIPIIVSNFPMWKEIVEKYKCGICVDPTNPTEIRNAIIYLVNNPQIALEMGQNGKNAILNEYNWETESKKLIQLYDSLDNC
jgi:glycosyltransferase involved in cell wall biosynthesis